MRRSPLSLLLVALMTMIAGCGDSNGDDDDVAAPEPEPPPANTADFDVTLSAREVIGGGTDTGSATSDLTVDLDDGSVSGTVTLSGLEAETVTLRRGFAGERGPALMDLQEESASEWSFPGSASLSQEERDALQDGGLYLHVTSAAAPEGALRGQIVPEELEILFVDLSGRQQVPPLETTATATAGLTLDPGTGALVLHMNTEGLNDAAEAHIHEAIAGRNGDITVGLVQDPDDVAHWMLEDFTLDEAQQDALNAGRLYINVHTPANPPGEVRGQIQPEGLEIFFNALRGDDVAPPVSTDASGVAASTLAPDSRELTLHVNLLELDDAESVAVHQAPVMQNGPVAFSLDQDANDLGHWSATDVTLTDAQFQALRDEELYVTATTAEFPDGEVRGLLNPDAPSPDGGDGGGDDDGGSTTPTLSLLQAEIFTPSCAKSGCHAGSAPAQGMNLSEGETFANTVDVPSLQVPSLDRIEPGAPDDSYLVRKVEGTASVGGRMPLDGPPFLSDDQIQDLRAWIAAGAEDN